MKKVYIESYGCQMNFSDSEIVLSILKGDGYDATRDISEASLVLLNTCSIREKAEETIRKRLSQLNPIRKQHKMKIGILGCMAERVKETLLEEEKLVDLVVGPDAYRSLPSLLEEISENKKAINVLLSKEETYGDLSPVRLNTNGVTAFVSITRGCDNMCTFCVVPFTRGRERSRSDASILAELQDLWDSGYREVTLLGQNVDSYLWYGGGAKKDFKKASLEQQTMAVTFSKLLDRAAQHFPKMRIRFSTSNPQDMTEDVLKVMVNHPNICRSIHLPVQSGSNRILKEMNRLHTREEYMELVDKIYNYLPDCAISQDMMSGFPSETEQDHQDTLSLMEYVKYHFGYMFAYSERPGTLAARKLKDDVPEHVKKKRLAEIIALQNKHSLMRKEEATGQIKEVLIEGKSKKSSDHWFGRDSQNSVVVFDKKNYQPGDFVRVKVNRCTSATLIGAPLEVVKC